MKFTLTKKYADIQNFLLKEMKFVYTDKQDNLFIEDVALLEKASFYELENIFLIFGFKRQTTILNLNSKERVNLTAKSVIKFDNKNNNLFLTSNSNQNYCRLSFYNIFSQKEKILIENYSWGLIHTHENQLFIIDKFIFRSLSLLTGLYEWELDLGLQDLEISSILGVKEDNLIFLCNKEIHKNILLALDIRTGEEVWARDMNFGSGFILNVDSSAVINLYAGGFWLNGVQMAQGNNIFREIDPANGSIKREGVLQELDNLGLGVKHFVLNEDNICFTANYNGSFGAIVVGVLDYETLSLLWWEEVKMDEADGFGNFLLQLQVSENKIYVLDKTGTLHIYERDETIPFEKPLINGLLAFEYLPAQNIDNQNFNETDDLPF